MLKTHQKGKSRTSRLLQQSSLPGVSMTHPLKNGVITQNKGSWTHFQRVMEAPGMLFLVVLQGTCWVFANRMDQVLANGRYPNGLVAWTIGRKNGTPRWLTRWEGERDDLFWGTASLYLDFSPCLRFTRATHFGYLCLTHSHFGYFRVVACALAQPVVLPIWFSSKGRFARWEQKWVFRCFPHEDLEDAGISNGPRVHVAKSLDLVSANFLRK